MEGASMITDKRIVVAVDESEESMYALSWCLSNLISSNGNDTIVLLYVKPPPPLHSSFDAAGYMFEKDAVACLKKYGNDQVDSVMQRAQSVYRKFATDINVEKVIESGEAKDVICDKVAKLKADTLVMGSHNYGFFKRAILGSVSDYCAKHVKCPLVIVKHPEKK